MKIACRVVAVAALIGILATFAMIQQYSSLMNNAVDVSGETQSGFLLFSPLFEFLATTASSLSFASGVVGMVVAGQRRQRIWFAILLAAVVVETYASVAIIMIPALAQFVFTVGSVHDSLWRRKRSTSPPGDSELRHRATVRSANDVHL